MPYDRRSKMSRRALLKTGMTLSLAALIPLYVNGKNASANSKASKATMMYQDKPHGKDECSNCIHFHPGKNAHALGTCAVVAGTISPKAWCVAYARKSGA